MWRLVFWMVAMLVFVKRELYYMYVSSREMAELQYRMTTKEEVSMSQRALMGAITNRMYQVVLQRCVEATERSVTQTKCQEVS
jgi:hypothetical protein